MRRSAWLVFALAAIAAPLACVERDRLCMSTIECGTASACVAGRCQAILKDDAGRPIPPEIESPEVRRVVASPTDVAYVSASGGSSPSALPPVLVLGRAGDDAALLLRFAVPIDEHESVVEAYVLLDRADVVESDPYPIALHAARIVDAWDGRSISWARQPRWEETGSPAAVVTGGGRPLVRIDVRDLVSHWKERDPRDQGIAILANVTSKTGMAFAAASSVSDRGPTSMLGAAPEDRASWVAAPPRLELYLRRGPARGTVNLPVPAPSNVPTDAGTRNQLRKVQKP